MMRKSLLFMVFVLLAFGIAAQEGTPIPTDPVQETRVTHEGVRFSFDSMLAGSVSVLPLEAQSQGPAPAPAYTEYLFEGYVYDTSFAPWARVAVLPTSEFGQVAFYGEQLALLNNLLAARPDLNAYVNAAPGTPDALTLPFLPALNAAQVFRTHVEYIDIPGLSGIRYVTYYSQSVDPVIEGQVFYTFQGVTDDGQYYVSTIFPLSTGLLETEFTPIDDYEAFAANFQPYLDDVMQRINSADGETFTPALSTLDDVVLSIRVNR